MLHSTINCRKLALNLLSCLKSYMW